MTLENRKKLQVVLENALCDTAPVIVRFDEETQKKIYLLLLSMIYELNEKDKLAKTGAEEDLCFCQRLREILINFSILKVPDIFGQEYLQLFTDLANNLGNLSIHVNYLSTLLNKEYTDRIVNEVQNDISMH